MEFARGVGKVLSREREAHEIGRAARDARYGARGEQAPEGRLTGFQRTLLDDPARGKVGNGRARGARLSLRGLQRAVRI